MDLKILKALGYVVVRKEQPDLTMEGARDIKLGRLMSDSDSIVELFDDLTIGDLEDLEELTGLAFDEIVARISGEADAEPTGAPKAKAAPKEPQDRKPKSRSRKKASEKAA